MKKSLHWFIVLGMVAGLLAALLPTAGPVHGATLGWSTTNLPRVGSTRNQVLNQKKGTVMAVSPDYANDSRVWLAADVLGGITGGITDDLFRSTNGGKTWSSVDVDGSLINNDIVAIVPSPFFATDSTLFVATTTTVFRSTNSGSSFSQLGGDQGSINGDEVISSMAVSPNYNGIGEIAIGLVDPAAGVGDCPTGPNGGDDCVRVWGRSNVLNWASPAIADTGSGGKGDMSADVTSIAYSPAFSGDGVLMVVASAAAARGALEETGSFLVHLVGATSFWGSVFGNITITTDVEDVGDAEGGIFSSSIALPTDYDGSDSATRMAFVGFNSNGFDSAAAVSLDDDDGVYRVTTSATLVSPAGDTGAEGITTVAYAGTRSAGTLLATSANAGAANVVFRSVDANDSTGVVYSARRPIPGDDSAAGTSGTVAFAPDGLTAFALIDSLDGRDGGFSRSTDGGYTWVQVSHMRNVGVFSDMTATIAGFAAAPDFDTSQHLVLATGDNSDNPDGGEDAILRSADAGSTWERGESVVLGEAPESVVFAYSPGFASDSTIYYGIVGDTVLKRSTDGGTTWSNRSLVTCSDSKIVSLLALDQNTILTGCADGDVFRSINGGFLFSQSTGTPGSGVSSIVMSPNFATDNEILMGAEGDVRRSTDGGTSFTRVGTTGPGTGGTTDVAFHPDYASNGMVFAANVDSGDGVYRWSVGTSSSWLSLGLNPDATTELAQAIAFGSDGALYVSDGEAFDNNSGTRSGGVWSSVTSASGSATSASGVSFSQLQVTSNATNLAQGDVVSGLAVATVSSNRIWVAETSSTAADKLRHYTDTITAAVVPTGLTPADGSTGVGTSNSTATGIIGFSIGWDAVSGATEYQYQWGISPSFASSQTETSASSASRTIAEGGIITADAGTGDTVGARLAGTTYYLRVRVSRPVVGAYSPGQSFTTLLLAGSTTGVPTLTQPNATNSVAALSSSVALRPLFVWSAVSGATNYELQVSTDGTFIDTSQILINRIGTDALGNTLAFQATIDLQPGTVYFWRVRGISGTTVGAYPPAAAFTTSREAVGGAVAAGTALANLEAVGTLELVSSFNYTTALFEAYVPGLAGNVLAAIAPNTVIFITVTADTTVVVSGVAFDIRANTPTPVPVGVSVIIAVQ